MEIAGRAPTKQLRQAICAAKMALYWLWGWRYFPGSWMCCPRNWSQCGWVLAKTAGVSETSQLCEVSAGRVGKGSTLGWDRPAWKRKTSWEHILRWTVADIIKSHEADQQDNSEIWFGEQVDQKKEWHSLVKISLDIKLLDRAYVLHQGFALGECIIVAVASWKFCKSLVQHAVWCSGFWYTVWQGTKSRAYDAHRAKEHTRHILRGLILSPKGFCSRTMLAEQRHNRQQVNTWLKMFAAWNKNPIAKIKALSTLLTASLLAGLLAGWLAMEDSRSSFGYPGLTSQFCNHSIIQYVHDFPIIIWLVVWKIVILIVVNRV